MITRVVAVDPAEFARDHWGRAPLLSRSADLPHNFQDLLSPDAVDELIAERGVRTPFIRLARDGSVLDRTCFTGSAGFGAEMPDQIDSAKVSAEFAAGATIVLQGLHRVWPPIIDFVRSMVDDLGHPVQTNAYVTPPSNRGFDPHYDVHDVFVLQVSGEKHWAIHPPVHADPLPNQPWTDHRDAIAALDGTRPVIDAVLRPGDALYLPRGWIHSATALGDTSIHLTVGVAPFTRYDLAHRVLTNLANNDDLRTSLPMTLDLTDVGAVGAEVRKTVETILEALRTDNSVESTVAQSIGTRFAELTRPAAVRPIRTLNAVASLTGTSEVAWRHGLIGTVRRNPASVALVLPDRKITFPSVCADALDAVRSGRTVTADSLPGLTEEDGLVVVRRLLREAVVVALA